MIATPSLGALLNLGSAELNKLRLEDKLSRDFTGATLVRVFCANANLEGLELTGSEWERCELSKVVFRNADLSNAYFHGGQLEDCDFTGSNLEGASFEKVKLARCDFTDARGLKELELTDVILRDVVGLPEEGDDEDDDSNADAEAESIVLLRDLLPKGFRRLPLDELLKEAAKHLGVEVGVPGKETDVQALEAAFGTKFPADYRAFLLRFGDLKVVGSKSYAFGALEVFGIASLAKAHKAYLAEFKDWGFNPSYLDEKSSDETPPEASGTLAQRRSKFRDSLKLADVHVKRFFGDLHDAMRVAYQFLIPTITTPGELHQTVECVGPDALMYTVSIKDWTVEPPNGTFTSRLLQHLENVVIGEPKAETKAE